MDLPAEKRIKNIFIKPIFRCISLGVCLVLCSLGAVSCSRESSRTQFAMGTVCTISVFNDGSDSLYGELFARITEIEKEFSVNIPSSVVSHINAAAGDHPVAVSEDVLYVTETALKYAELTNGAFDPTVGPLVKLWGINTDHAHVPTKQELDAALPLIDWRDVVVADNGGTGTVFLKRNGMSLDFGGIAKGFTADELVKILKKHHVKRAIIDLGGNVYVYGKKRGGSLWKVGVKNPDDVDGDPALILSLSNSTVVTSGVYERFFVQDGIRYHHILDIHTGYPAQTGIASATIVSESSIAADALSTSVFLLGVDGGMNLIKRIQTDESLQKIPGLGTTVSAIFIGEDGTITASAALKDVLSVTTADKKTPVFK